MAKQLNLLLKSYPALGIKLTLPVVKETVASLSTLKVFLVGELLKSAKEIEKSAFLPSVNLKEPSELDGFSKKERVKEDNG